MEMIGIDLWAKTYVVLKNQKIICTENTLDYIEQQMMRKDEEKITLTLSSWLHNIQLPVKKTDIESYYSKGEKNAEKNLTINA